jgi:cell division protein FtsB
MPTPKFQKGNPGKPKGAKRKKTVEAIQRVEWAINILEKNLESDIERLQARDRVQLWNDLQEYVRPKLARKDLDASNKDEITITVVRRAK